MPMHHFASVEYMNLVITGLIYLYWIYSENTNEIDAFLKSPYASILNDTKFYIGVCIACLYFGFLMSYEKVLYVITMVLTSIVVVLYMEQLRLPKSPEEAPEEPAAEAPAEPAAEVPAEPVLQMQQIIAHIQRMRAAVAASAANEQQ